MKHECIKSCNCGVCKRHATSNHWHASRRAGLRKLRHLYSIALHANPTETPLVAVSIPPQG